MSLLSIDGYLLKKFIIFGANMLAENKEKVDELNVFPVPDGDTGTNMSLTVLAAAKEVEKINTPNIYDVSKAASNGSLRGARGNSGVILSQLFRGFSKGLEGKDTANSDDLALAFVKAKETAYKAVMKPKEGTILTIAEALSEKAVEMSYKTDDINEMMKEVIEHTKNVLKKTKDMLPQLKQAGVVDAGGRGLLYIIEGGFENIDNDNVEIYDTSSNNVNLEFSKPKGIENIEIKYGYCTEFFINIKNSDEKTEKDLKSYLQSIGDSIVMVSDEDIIKVHVHTNNPGNVLERAIKIGDLENIKIENMRIQHTNRISFSEKTEDENIEVLEKKEIGFVVVSSGDGLSNIFKELGADKIIEGGQTMNPSTDDIISAIEQVNADNIIVLPNNKNIILAAQQASELIKDKKVEVLITKTIPQGMSAIINFMPGNSFEENINAMKESIEAVCTGQITYAVRNTVIDNKKINEGDFLCMIEDEIILVEKNLKNGIEKLIDKMIDKNENSTFITLYYGKDVTKEDAERIKENVIKKYPDFDVELQSGNQPVYYYIVSIE